MKRSLLLLLFGLLIACEDRTILHPGFPEVEDDTVFFDFNYRVSTNYYGFVQFQNLSRNIISYEWSFGFLDKSGNLVTSKASSPGIFFPANGHYQVRLKGQDIHYKDFTVSKIIEISNFP